MVKTPRMRGGAKKPPATIDLAPDEVRRVDEAPDAGLPAADSPEARFAAQESLTPGEDATPAAPADDATVGARTDALPADALPADVLPEAAAQADTFRFPEETAAAPPPADIEPREEGDGTPQRLSDLSEETGPQPGDASTPLFADPPPTPADADEPDEAPAAAGTGPATVAAAPASRSAGFGRFAAAGFIGGALALLLAGLLQYLGTLPSLDRSAGLDAAAVRTEIDGLRAEVAQLREAGNAVNPEMAGALDTLRADVAALRDAGGGAASDLAERLNGVEQRVEALNGERVTPAQVASLAEQANGAAEQAGAARAAAEANAQAISQAVADSGGRIEALESKVAALEPKVAAVSEQPRIALALAASGLKEAAERGVPFEAELATLGAIRPDLPEIAELQPLAASGVPTLETVRGEWAAAADAMVAAANPGDADAGLASRLWSSASGLVSVRPVGAVEGTSADAIVARMDAAVQDGDLAKALGEYDTLPDAAKSAGAAWAEKARALEAAGRLIDRAIASAGKAS